MDEQAVSQSLVAPASRLVVRGELGVTRIGFPGSEVDGNTVRELYEAAVQLTNGRGAKLIVDLTGVRFASSGFMGMLVTIHKKLRSAGGSLCVVIPNANVREQFAIMRLDQLLS